MGGDGRKVGYYTGIIVRLSLPWIECIKNSILDVPLLCCGGDHGLSLEPSFRPHWSQARTLSVPHVYDHFDGPLRPLPFFLDHRLEVPFPCLPERLFSDLVHHSRCLHGAVRGNIGTVKSAMAELTDDTNEARGFSLLPVTWAFGYVIGFAMISPSSTTSHVP